MVDKVAEALHAQMGSELPWPDTRVVKREGWYQIITPSTGSDVANEVCLSQIADEDADAVIDRTCAEYAAEGVPFKWFVGPETVPVDTGRRLEARGFEGIRVRGMAIAPSAWRSTVSADVTVEVVTTATLDEYIECLASGWNLPMTRDQRATFERALGCDRFEFFLARVDGTPAGTCGSVYKPRCVYLVGGNTIAAHRHRGVYRAMLAMRLARASVAGRSLAVTQAREESSAPILEKLGFESLASATIYRNEARRDG